MGNAGDRTAFSTHVRRAVGQHRAAQRAHRGDVQRLYHCQDLRSSCSCPAAVRRVQRRCVPDQLWGAVLFGSGVTGDRVHRQYQLRGGGGGRWTSGRDGSDHARQYPGLHPVRPPVQPAADPGRRHVQHAAIRRGQRGTSIRAARRGGGVRRACADASFTPRGVPVASSSETSTSVIARAHPSSRICR